MKKQIKNFNVLIEQDEDGMFVSEVIGLQGCHTQGKNLDELMERTKEAIKVCLEGDNEEVNPMRFVGIQRVQVKTD